MLGKLTISNYVLIDNSEIIFNKGLNIITGETGAGKSILLNALGLLMGQRAESGLILNQEKKCFVEGEFYIGDYELVDFFEINNLDYSNNTIIRREIAVNGTSRAFINDTPVTLNILKELANYLVDIHSQHQTLNLGNGIFQLNVLDSVCLHTNLVNEYKQNFKEYKILKKQLDDLLLEASNSKKELDFLQFQFNELDEAGLEKINQSQLEEELETLTNAEEIKRNLLQAVNLVSENEHNALQTLTQIKQLLVKYSSKNNKLSELTERLNSLILEIKDWQNEVNDFENSVTYNPSLIDEINNTLSKLYHLQKKHQVNTVNDLQLLMSNISNRLNSIENIDSSIDKIKKQLTTQETLLSTIADKLNANRTKAIIKIEAEVHELLAQLNMKNARLKIELSVSEDFLFNGKNKVVFLFSANKGAELSEISKVASGGELSRLMLCLKSITAQHKKLPTIIFDEIDTGVSGEVADKIGTILKNIGSQMQVIAITHLPQLASKGNNHYYVYKEDTNERTYSKIKTLTRDERVKEIAKMLSNDKPTDAAIKNAKELLNIN